MKFSRRSFLPIIFPVLMAMRIFSGEFALAGDTRRDSAESILRNIADRNRTPNEFFAYREGDIRRALDLLRQNPTLSLDLDIAESFLSERMRPFLLADKDSVEILNQLVAHLGSPHKEIFRSLVIELAREKFRWAGNPWKLNAAAFLYGNKSSDAGIEDFMRASLTPMVLIDPDADEVESGRESEKRVKKLEMFIYALGQRGKINAPASWRLPLRDYSLGMKVLGPLAKRDKDPNIRELATEALEQLVEQRPWISRCYLSFLQ